MRGRRTLARRPPSPTLFPCPSRVSAPHQPAARPHPRGLAQIAARCPSPRAPPSPPPATAIREILHACRKHTNGDVIELWPVPDAPGYHRLLCYHGLLADDGEWDGQTTYDTRGAAYADRPDLLRAVLESLGWPADGDWLVREWDESEPAVIVEHRADPATTHKVPARRAER